VREFNTNPPTFPHYTGRLRLEELTLAGAECDSPSEKEKDGEKEKSGVMRSVKILGQARRSG
jgi:hypothetical protein